MDALLFPAGCHLLATQASLAEIFLAIGDRRWTLADHLGLEISDDRSDLALLQPSSRRRRLFVTDILGGHAIALLALGPGKFVEMRHRGAAGDTATDHLDQLVVVKLGLAQIGGLARRLWVAGAVARPTMAEPAGCLILVEPLAEANVARGLRRGRQGDHQCRSECEPKCDPVRHSLSYSLMSGLYTVRSITAVFQSLSFTRVTVATAGLSRLASLTASRSSRVARNMPSFCFFASVRSSPPVMGSALVISPDVWSTITSKYLDPSLTVYTESCGVPFSISNLAETGLPFFLLVSRPCSSVTVAPLTIGASSALSLSLIAATAGMVHKATVRTHNKVAGILAITTSLRFSDVLIGAVSGLASPIRRQCTESLSDLGAGVGVDLQSYRNLDDDRSE